MAKKRAGVKLPELLCRCVLTAVKVEDAWLGEWGHLSQLHVLGVSIGLGTAELDQRPVCGLAPNFLEKWRSVDGSGEITGQAWWRSGINVAAPVDVN